MSYELNFNSIELSSNILQCNKCSNSCYEWSGSGTDQCLSCKNGYYLKLNKDSIQLGTCLTKSEEDKIVELFVSNVILDTSEDGSYDKPFSHIVKALEYGYDQVAPYAKGYINIYLLNGNHYMTRNITNYKIKRNATDKYSGNQEIFIVPVFWDEIYADQYFDDEDSDCVSEGSQITVYYQMGNSFYFTVPESFNISNIIFDALDSSINYTSTWLTENHSCWSISDDKSLTLDDSNIDTSTNCSIVYKQDGICSYTTGDQLFKFYYADTDLSNMNSAGTLNINSCTFQHFFHDYTSLISFANGHGHVKITNSKFQKFSNWASIISYVAGDQNLASFTTNSKYFVNTDKLDSTFDFTTYDSYWRAYRTTALIQQHEYYVEPSQQCRDSSCGSILIENSQFSDFEYMKDEVTGQYLLNYNNTHTKSMTLLMLNRYGGKIVITNNKFHNMKNKNRLWTQDRLSVTTKSSQSFYYSTLQAQSKGLIWASLS